MKHFPDINQIKLLEKNSQKNGSGILYEELLGIWKFKYVWGKESDEIKNISSSILQVLSARLELKSKNKEDQINYEIKNSIKFSKNKKILLNLFIYSFSSLILIFINYLLSLNGLTSLIIFNAAIITLIYFELALYLEKVFWDDFLGNSLPKSINMLISFVVMMNFGYFTLMFYIKILDIDYFVT